MITFGSLFSGIGGFDLGFGQSGMECAWQCEIDKDCQKILKKHFNKEIFSDVKEITKENAKRVNLICGGFPCQDVSLGGKRKGLAGERSGLWFEFRRILSELLPEWAVIENVPGLLTSNGGNDFATILRGLGELGYFSAWRILDTKNFGIPQSRERLYLVGNLRRGCAAEVLFNSKRMFWNKETIRNEEIENPESDCGDECNQLAPFSAFWWDGGGITQTLDHVLYKKQAMPEKRRFPAVLVPAWGKCSMCEDYKCNIHHKHAFECDCPSIEWWDENGSYPYDPLILRYITPLESERLQGFPDGWTDGQSDTTRYRQLGNAVSVPVVKWIGQNIVSNEIHTES